MYTPVPLLVLLALLAAAFGLVPSPHAQAVVHTLLVATLAASVLHLQARAGARVPMLAAPGVLLACATLFSFVPRLSRITPVVFLVCIVATLATTACLFRRCASVAPPPSPAPSHTSFEKPLLISPRRTSLPLVLLLCAQLSYTLATAFCIPPALHTSGPASPLVISLISVPHLTATHVFRILDTTFTVLALLFVCAAYYHPSRALAPTVPRHPPPVLSKPPFPSSATTTPPPPAPAPIPTLLPPLRLPPGTRMSPGPAPCSPVLVTPPPIVCKRAWSWHTPSPSPDDDPSEHEEGDFRDLRDPFAPVPVPAPAPVGVGAPPSAYHRWAGSHASESAIDVGAGKAGVGASPNRRPRSSSYDACMPPPQTQTPTRMSTWGRLPLPPGPNPNSHPSMNPSPSPSPSPTRVHFNPDTPRPAPRPFAFAMHGAPVRPRTPPPPPLPPTRLMRRQVCEREVRDKERGKERDRDRDEGARVREDALIAQRLLVRLAGAGEV